MSLTINENQFETVYHGEKEFAYGEVMNGKRYTVHINTTDSIEELKAKINSTSFQVLNVDDIDLKEYHLLDICYKDNGYIFTFSTEELEYDIDTIFDNYDNINNFLNQYSFQHKYPDEYYLELRKLKHISDDYWRFLKYTGYTVLAKEWLDPFCDMLQGKTVLEVGAGNGALSKYLHDNDINVVAIDNRSYKFARKNYQWDVNKWYDVIEESYQNYSKDFEYIILANPVNNGITKEIYDSLTNNQHFIFIGNFIDEYTGDNLPSTITLSEDNKIFKDYQFWFDVPYTSIANILLLK